MILAHCVRSAAGDGQDVVVVEVSDMLNMRESHARATERAFVDCNPGIPNREWVLAHVPSCPCEFWPKTYSCCKPLFVSFLLCHLSPTATYATTAA
jgi:predicted LPLAT superfamily acyltransferase